MFFDTKNWLRSFWDAVLPWNTLKFNFLLYRPSTIVVTKEFFQASEESFFTWIHPSWILEGSGNAFSLPMRLCKKTRSPVWFMLIYTCMTNGKKPEFILLDNNEDLNVIYPRSLFEAANLFRIKTSDNNTAVEHFCRKENSNTNIELEIESCQKQKTVINLQ